MIAAWMLYGILVAIQLSAAALLLERAAAVLGRARRWVWVVAITSSIGLPLVGLLGWSVAGAGHEARILPAAASRAVRDALDPLTIYGDGGGLTGPGLDTVLLVAWGLASAGLIAMLLRSHLALVRARRRWEPSAPESVDARAPVFLTDDFGPAVAGLRRGEIVLPRWWLELPSVERELVLAHEVEHLRGGDVRLLLVARLAVIALPWLLPLWWNVYRLRLAIELDCDGRLLRRGIDASRYGELLLEVGRRRSAARPAVALAEPASHLERRIRALIERKPRRRWFHAIAAVAAGLAIVAVACESPTPTDDKTTTNGTSTAREVGESQAHEFGYVPRDEEPVLQNRAKLLDVMQRASAAAFEAEEPDEALTTELFMFVDESGQVVETRVEASSGRPELDEAAQVAAHLARFRPAKRDGEPIGVWIKLPFRFEVH